MWDYMEGKSKKLKNMGSIVYGVEMWKVLFLVTFVNGVLNKLDEDDQEFFDSSGEQEFDESAQKIGASVVQVYNHPYAASLLKNGTYLCSAVVLNTYWLLTLSKCFEPNIISSYVTQKNLGNFSIRAGSSYNYKDGKLHKIKMLTNNFDLRISAVKLDTPLEFDSNLQAANLPAPGDEITYGYLASMIAWTPTGHMRVVNAPVLEPTICESDTKMLPGHYICLGGVQDPNRHFCRKDNGGAVIQNNTLIGISNFRNSCAQYIKTHAFPKLSSFVHWLHTTIWDETRRPTTTDKERTKATTPEIILNDDDNLTRDEYDAVTYSDPSRYMLTLPFQPINLPLEPAGDNQVLPGMSFYESYLQSLYKKPLVASTKRPESTEKPHKQEHLVGPRMYGRQPIKFYDPYGYV